MTDTPAHLAGRPGRLIAASLRPGEQLTGRIEEICRDNGVRTAIITSVIGTISEVYTCETRATSRRYPSVKNMNSLTTLTR